MTDAELDEHVQNLKAMYDGAYREFVARRAVADINRTIRAVTCYGDPDDNK
jgi:hypothetical protein